MTLSCLYTVGSVRFAAVCLLSTSLHISIWHSWVQKQWFVKKLFCRFISKYVLYLFLWYLYDISVSCKSKHYELVWMISCPWPCLDDGCLRVYSMCVCAHVPVEEEQNWQHGLVNVAVADALVKQVAGVTDHRLQRVLSHDGVQLVCVQVLEHQLVPELSEVIDGVRASQAGESRSSWFWFTSIGQIQAAAAAVKANGGKTVLVWHWANSREDRVPLTCASTNTQLQSVTLAVLKLQRSRHVSVLIVNV